MLNHSLGQPYRRGHTQFYSRDLLDDFSNECAIPEDEAIRAAEYFVEHGVRPPANWEGDW